MGRRRFPSRPRTRDGAGAGEGWKVGPEPVPAQTRLPAHHRLSFLQHPLTSHPSLRPSPPPPRPPHRLALAPVHCTHRCTAGRTQQLRLLTDPKTLRDRAWRPLVGKAQRGDGPRRGAGPGRRRRARRTQRPGASAGTRRTGSTGPAYLWVSGEAGRTRQSAALSSPRPGLPRRRTRSPRLPGPRSAGAPRLFGDPVPENRNAPLGLFRPPNTPPVTVRPNEPRPPERKETNEEARSVGGSEPHRAIVDDAGLSTRTAERTGVDQGPSTRGRKGCLVDLPPLRKAPLS